MSNANAGATPLAGDAVWRAFHGRAGVDRMVDDFVARNRADSRIADIFHNQDHARLARTLKEQFCHILGGGCDYSGRDTAAAQNRLLAKLASMHRAVVAR